MIPQNIPNTEIKTPVQVELLNGNFNLMIDEINRPYKDVGKPEKALAKAKVLGAITRWKYAINRKSF